MVHILTMSIFSGGSNLVYQQSEHEKIAVSVSRNTIIINLILFLFKFIAGIIGKSAAMISDSIHSASDVISTVVVIIGVKLSSKESDVKHPYGHERIECIAAVLLGGILFLTGVGIAVSGIQKAFFNAGGVYVEPKGIALVAAVLSIIVKEGMYWYTKLAAEKIHSDALRADAWHHRSDALSSIGSFIGIAGAKLGHPICDPIACILISFFIMKVAVEIVVDSFRKLIDESCDVDLVEKMRQTVMEQEGVLGIDDMKTRLFGSKIYVDIDIVADGELTLFEGHEIAERVHLAIENAYPDVKHCMVHVNPNQPFAHKP